jgi:hypothetical protein
VSLSGGNEVETLNIEQKAIHVKNKEELDTIYRYKTFTNYVLLKFKDLHEHVLNGDFDLRIIDESDTEDEIEDESITNYFHYSHRDVNWDEDEEKFASFFILRTMDFEPTLSVMQYTRSQKNIERYSHLKRKREESRSLLSEEEE